MQHLLTTGTDVTWRKLFSPCLQADHWLGWNNQENCVVFFCIRTMYHYYAYLAPVSCQFHDIPFISHQYFALSHKLDPIGPDNITYQLSVCTACYFGLIVDDTVGK